ncbi:MAG TPA: hypothetical protein VLD62_03745 [Acidimicrobiia bacterium]|nr:hypothetical protein [Acidimicrobiia bacterium]
MRRLPNPWVMIPVVLAALAGGVVGGLVTEVSCRPGSCIPLSVGLGLVSAVAAAAGTITIVVLAVRSVAEWREYGPPEESSEDSGPPTC